MNQDLAERLHAEGLLSDLSLKRIQEQKPRLFSVYYELKTLFYLGVVLLSTGLGILVYQNIETIGHGFVVAFIAAVSGGSFYYSFSKKTTFSREKVESSGMVSDYLLLLGCLTFVTLIGYLQYSYDVFGERYGLAVFAPIPVLFFSAYYFDHLGVLGLAITNLAAWAGIAITPLQILRKNDFSSPHMIVTALALGAVLYVAALISERKKIKAHFAFTYTNFGVNLFFIACLGGMMYFKDHSLLWLLLIGGTAAWFYLESMRLRSFYLLAILSLYAYVALAYEMTRLIFSTGSDLGEVFLLFLYFIFSAAGLIWFLVHSGKRMKQHDRV